VKKAVAFALCASALSLLLSLAIAHPDGSRPDGVASEAWIALSPEAGFVVTGAAHGTTTPSLNGYLMARRDGKWMRLEPQTGGQLVHIN
jgi:hypothetical protein